MTPRARRRPALLAVGALAAGLAAGACGGGDDAARYARGRGLQPAGLAPSAQAGAYTAALGAAFELEPALSLLLDPRQLPRDAGFGAGPPMPPAVVAELRRRGVVRGSCQPPLDTSAGPTRREAPPCEAADPGYVVRASDVFRVAADTVQVHLGAERYRTPNGGPQEALAFEKVYKLAARGDAWRVVGEARAP